MNTTTPTETAAARQKSALIPHHLVMFARSAIRDGHTRDQFFDMRPEPMHTCAAAWSMALAVNLGAAYDVDDIASAIAEAREGVQP